MRQPYFCALILSMIVLSARAQDAPRRPNVLVILTDDQGWADLSLNGNRNLATPNVDSLARDGARFERFYVCPVCSPTRAEFLTGRWHPRCGVRGVSTGGERLDLDERTIADVSRAAGYATGCFGKWHNGTQYPYHPRGRGFDEYYGFTSGHWGTYFDPPLDHNGEVVRGKGYLADDLTERAMGFMGEHVAVGQPFFCYVAYNTPHSPMQVPDRFYDKFAKAELSMRAANPRQEDVGHTRAALAMCENIDWNVGRMLAKLEDLKVARDTIVVYFHDNGPNGVRWNGGMRGRKGSVDEGGVRSPLLVRWPGRIVAGRRVEEVASAVDLMPTLVDLAGVEAKGGNPLDGVSLKPLLTGEGNVRWADRMIFSHWNGRVSVRTKRWRLDAEGRLYDMEADPGQTRDVGAANGEVARKLSQAVEDWKRDVLVELRGKDDRPHPVGYREMRLTQLPARDGVPHGNVRRSASAPNCSFFEGWRSTDDRMTWDVEVKTVGKYEVEVLYTCAAGDVGSVIEMTLNGSRVEAKVAEAHDPPLVGAEQDRVPRRGESYVKDFKALRLGVMEVKARRGELVLRALKVAKGKVADVRGVSLRLLD
jgi:arylsulfatase A-like enzyme